MMRSQSIVLAMAGAASLAVLASCGSSDAEARGGSGVAAPGSTTHPVVVELFQSQGCSSCPPANAYLNVLADRSDILTLSFAVTYWDQLGWKDTFASPEFTARQRAYAAAGTGQVATPEFIVDGSAAVVGSDRRALDASIARAKAKPAGPGIALSANKVRIAAASGRQPAEVLLVRYDPQSRNVPIQAGENSGRTLPHRHIVRQLVRLGSWNGAAAEFALPRPAEAGLDTVVLVQRENGGEILSAAKI